MGHIEGKNVAFINHILNTFYAQNVCVFLQMIGLITVESIVMSTFITYLSHLNPKA